VDKAEEILDALRSGKGWIGELNAVRKDVSTTLCFAQNDIRGVSELKVTLGERQFARSDMG
jgi:hypothetical protein